MAMAETHFQPLGDRKLITDKKPLYNKVGCIARDPHDDSLHFAFSSWTHDEDWLKNETFKPLAGMRYKLLVDGSGARVEASKLLSSFEDTTRPATPEELVLLYKFSLLFKRVKKSKEVNILSKLAKNA